MALHTRRLIRDSMAARAQSSCSGACNTAGHACPHVLMASIDHLLTLQMHTSLPVHADGRPETLLRDMAAGLPV